MPKSIRIDIRWFDFDHILLNGDETEEEIEAAVRRVVSKWSPKHAMLDEYDWEIEEDHENA